jgi:DNA-binding transcriptional MerR regulator
MDTLPIEDIARTFEVPVETIRSYAQRFALFVPAVRTGDEVRYPPAGATLLGEIADAVRAGASFDEIESALHAHVPNTVVAASDPAVGAEAAAPPVEEIVRLLDDQRRLLADHVAGLAAAIERLATADQFHGLRAETASLAAALAQRDSQLQYANALIVAELRQSFAVLRQEIAHLHAELRPRVGEAAAVSAAAEHPDPAPIPDQPPSHRSTPPHRRTGGRTPRRMGQPLRLNGAVQS